MRLLLRAGVRELARRPAQPLLAVAGVALGVAVAVAVDLANESARRAFHLSTEATSGRATHSISAGSSGLDELLLARLRLDAGARAAAPVVEGSLALPDHPGRTLRLLGTDPFSDAPFRPILATGETPLPGLVALLVEPGAVALSRATAGDLGLRIGDRFAARAGPRRVELTVTAILEPRDDLARSALANLALADLATAQETLDRAGRLDRIELILPAGAAGRELEIRIRDLLPADARLEPAGARVAAVDRLTRAFRFNLRALSGLALLCGAFLIWNTASFSVVRRRDLFARLRATGVSGRELLGVVLGEAALVGALGGALGAGFGVLLGRGLVELVLSTVNDLYFALSVRDFAVPPSALLAGFALGLAATLAAALPPALEAARTPVRGALASSTVEERAGRGVRRAAGLGAAAVGGGLVLLALPSRSLGLALCALLLLVVGGAMIVPRLLAVAMRAVGRLPGSLAGLHSRLAARGLERSLARTGPAAAALALAVAVSLAVAVTIASFRSAVVEWLDATLSGDLYVSSPSGPGGPSGLFPPELAERLAALPGVERVRALRLATQPADDTGHSPVVVGVETDPDAFSGFRLRSGELDRARRAIAAGTGALISEPLAERRALVLGDRIELPTPTGELALEVAGIYVDYGSERGAIVVSAPLLEQRFSVRGLTAFALAVAPGSDLGLLARAVERSAAPLEVEVRSNRELKRYSLAVFDRTFRVTGVLRTLALVVAALGIAAALAALELERARHFGLLRALGLTRAGVAAVVLGESLGLGLAAGLAALPLGAGLATVLVGVVQRRSFGWSFPLELPVAPFAESVALAAGASLVAGTLAALRLARRSPAQALRDE